MRLIKITMCDDRKSTQPLINTLIPLVVTLMYFIKVSVFLCFPSVSEPAFLIHPGTQVASSCISSENSWFIEADPRSKDAARGLCSRRLMLLSLWSFLCAGSHWDKTAFFIFYRYFEHLSLWENTFCPLYKPHATGCSRLRRVRVKEEDGLRGSCVCPTSKGTPNIALILQAANYPAMWTVWNITVCWAQWAAGTCDTLLTSKSQHIQLLLSLRVVWSSWNNKSVRFVSAVNH